MIVVRLDHEIPKGYCVAYDTDKSIIFTGPLNELPDLDLGATLLINPIDYDSLKTWSQQ